MNSIDQSMFLLMDNIRNEALTTCVSAYSNIGYPLPMIIIVLLIAYMLIRKTKLNYAIFLVISMASEALLNPLIKNIVKRERPMYFGGIESGYSFPSGHAMSAIVFTMIMVYIIEKTSNSKHKKVYQTLFIVAGLLMGLSRVYLGVHYTTDIIGAWIIGSMWFYICVKVYEKMINKKEA